MSEKYDQLASRLAERLTTSPPRGGVTRPPADPAPTTAPGGASSGSTSTTPTTRSPRVAIIRRGHLVPADLHQRARREKVRRSVRTTWSDVLVDGVGRLLDHPDPMQVLATFSRTDQPMRLVQANLPIDVDQRFRERFLDLDEARVGRVTYEQMWAASIELWLGG